MPGPKADAGLDFAAILGHAATPPSTEESGRDLPDGFPFTRQEHHKVVEAGQEGIPGMLAYDYFIHRRGFVIYRPWDNCARCSSEVASGATPLPETGDLTCPHTSVLEYQAIVNDCLAGKMLFGSEQEITLKDGSIVISLRWYERKANPAKARPPPKEGGQKEEPAH